uniref:Ciliary associated calcium binding coiled-coil 1 n=1 Tax=Lepisosteus oculatus TaxID=7918 RepID=W5MIG0_LEPOC
NSNAVTSEEKKQITRRRNRFHQRREKAKTQIKSQENEHPLAWKFLSYSQVNLLLQLSVEEVEKQLEEILNFNNHQTCLKEAALLDYYVSGFRWAKEMNFTCQQVSGFMTLLCMALENIRDNQMPLAENFKEFYNAVVGTRQSTSAATEDGDNEFFSVGQVTSITEYMKSSLFQHYKLYEFLFTHPQEQLVLGIEESVEVLRSRDCLVVAPLEEGMPCEAFTQYVAPAPPEHSEDEFTEELEGNYEDKQNKANNEAKNAFECYAIDDVRSVLGPLTKDVLGSFQMEISEKLRVQEELYTARIDRLKNSSDS